jgi:hypothetical protein
MILCHREFINTRFNRFNLALRIDVPQRIYPTPTSVGLIWHSVLHFTENSSNTCCRRFIFTLINATHMNVARASHPVRSRLLHYTSSYPPANPCLITNLYSITNSYPFAASCPIRLLVTRAASPLSCIAVAICSDLPS